MQTATVQHPTPPATSAARRTDQTFPPLDQETRTHVGTEQAAFYCMRKPQTMRMWAALEPKGAIRPIRVNGRLAWPIAEIRKLLSGGAPEMKTPPNHTAFESAPDKRDYTPGTLPKRKNTVTAAVLAGLLESNYPTGLESVFKQSTTRLAAVIHYLARKYCWHIDRRSIATGTNDGRIEEITVY